MFRSLYAHHQEAELYRCSIWYRPLSQWPSGSQVEGELVLPQSAQWTATEGAIPDAASIQFSLLMMSIKCLKHVEDHNKLIVK